MFGGKNSTQIFYNNPQSTQKGFGMGINPNPPSNNSTNTELINNVVNLHANGSNPFQTNSNRNIVGNHQPNPFNLQKQSNNVAQVQAQPRAQDLQAQIHQFPSNVLINGANQQPTSMIGVQQHIQIPNFST